MDMCPEDLAVSLARLRSLVHSVLDCRCGTVLQVLVLLRQGSGATLAATVNAHSGELLSQRTLQQEVCQVLPENLATSTQTEPERTARFCSTT